MRHVDDGTLRRMVDEPFSVREAERMHVAECEACRRRLAAAGEDARATGQMFATATPAFSTSMGLARIRRQIASEGMAPATGWHTRLAAAFETQTARVK